MFCIKCGSRLEQGRCPNCDFVDDVVYGSQQENQLDRNTQTRSVVSKRPKEKETKQPKEKRIKQPKEKKPLTKKKKAVIISSVAAFVVLAAVGSFLAVYLITDAEYVEAIAMLEDENPQDAAEAFIDLGTFKESERYLQDSNDMADYFDAVDSMEDGDYEDAAKEFEALGDYDDSEDLEQLCRDNFNYENAKALFDEGKYQEAKVIYLSLANFEDSPNLAETCQLHLDYISANELMDYEENLAAKRIFETIILFQDSKDKLFICEQRIEFEYAVEKVGDEDYEAAYELLEGIERDIEVSDLEFEEVLDNREFNDVKNNCFKFVSYNRGKDFFEDELFYSAYLEFEKADNILDAKDMSESCKQSVKSKELYINDDYKKNSVKMTFHAPESGGKDICIKVFSDDGDLVSICLVEFDSKLKIYLPTGTYYFEKCYGNNWFGEKEFFGTDKKFISVTFEDGDTIKLKSNYYYSIKF